MKTEQLAIPCNDSVILTSWIIMDRSLFLWIGLAGDAPSLGNLVVAIETAYGTLSSPILDSNGTKGAPLAERISKRFKIQAFVADHLPELEGEDKLMLEKAIIDKISENY